MKNLILTGITLIFFAFLGKTQNCPSYSTVVSATGEACAGQNYSMTFENDGCNSEIYFNYNGNLLAGGSVDIISDFSGLSVYSETGTGAYSGTVGPLDPTVHGTEFTITTVNGTYTLTQNGVSVAVAVNQTRFFSLKPLISSATLTITTPSGNLTKTIDYCKDISIGVTLSNTQFCNTLNVALPWEIVCDQTAAVISSGTHNVVVYPEVPTNPNDLVDIVWDPVTCTWDVTANFDCDNNDIGTIFDISPAPSTVPANACADGNQTFTVNYSGFAAGPNCCTTAGPKDPILLNTSSGATVVNSPFGGINNAGFVTFPPNNTGGSASSVSLNVAVNGYCFNHTDPSGIVSVYVDDIVVANYPFSTPIFSYGFDLTFMPWYDANSTIEVYIHPNTLDNGGNNTTYSPGTNCGALNPMEWSGSISATLDVEFEDSIGAGLTCTSDSIIAFTNCTPDDPILILETAAACNLNSTVAVTNFDNSLSYTFVPAGPIISGTGIISGAAGNYTVSAGNGSCAGDETFTIDPGIPIPTFTLSSTNPTVCAGTDGTITLSGLDNNTTYAISYDDGGTAVGPINITSNGSGEAVITGLSAGSYNNFSAELNGCTGNDNSTIGLSDPNGPTVDAGTPQTICAGSSATLTASGYPVGATITWDNGVTDGVPFIPLATQTYTVTVLLNGCSATDVVTITLTPQDIPTFNAIPNFCENTTAPSLQVLSNENISGTWNPALIANTAGTTTYTFTPTAGLCAATVTLDVTVDPEPNPTINPVADLCISAASVTVVGNPAGGTFSGAGMTGDSFNPSTAGIGTHTITYTFTDGNGCTGSSTVDIVVNTNLDFTLTSTNPTVCGGSDGTVTIGGLSNNTNHIVSYDDNSVTVGPSVFISSASGEIVISGLNAGTYTDFYVEAGGCFRTDNTNINLSDPNAPTVDAGNPQTVCEGTVVTLTATNPNGAVISWDNGVTDGTPFTPATTQTYTVTASLNNCTAIDDVTITVNIQTVPTFNVATDFCVNNPPPTLPTISNENVNGTWSPAVVATTLGTSTYTFTPNAGECATNQTIDITVNPLPTPTIDPLADICEFAATVTLVGNPAGGVFSGPGVVGGDFDPSVAGLGTHTITYTYTDGNGCSADASTNVLVNTNIVFTVSFTEPTVCNGVDGTITLEGLDPSDVYDVSYFNGATVGPSVMNSNASGNIVLTGLNAGAYSDFEIIFNGCQGINNSSIVLDDPNAAAIDAGLDQVICPGNPVTLTAFNPDGAAIGWDNGITDGVSFVPSVGVTVYTVTASLVNCISTDQVTITVPGSITGLNCPADLTASCNISQQPAYADFDAFLAAGGSISIPAGGVIDSTSFTLLSETTDGNTCAEVITRTYQITDACGVQVSCSQIITVNDLINPTGTAPADITVQCTADVPAIDPTSITDEADNCTANPLVVHVSDVLTGSACLETITRTYNISDDCGNDINVVQIITISDNTAPTGTAAAITVQCAGDVPAPDVAYITDEADNCTVNPIVTYVGDASDGNTCPEIITRTYNIEDDCGNNVDVIQTITINDDIAPTGTAPGPLVFQCIGDVPLPDATLITDEADNCTAIPTVTFAGDVSDGNTCPEVITRSYAIADGCGNNTIVTQTITINDDTNPTGTAPAAMAFQCIGDIPAADVTLITDEADNCTANPTVTHTGDVSDGNTCPQVITRTYNIADDCGNSIDVTQEFTINDDILPTGTAPAAVAVQCFADIPAVDITSITDEADNCTVNPIVTHTGDVLDGNTCPLTVTRTYNIADDCGNSIDVTQLITVSDDILPTGTAPADLALQCTTDVPAADVALITDEADNCTVAPTVTHVGDVSDGNTCPQVITRTYNIADDCGNNIDVVQTITITDDVLPTGTAPADLAVQCITDVPAADITSITDEADNCTVNPIITHTGDVSDGNTCPEVITRTYNIADDCGNNIDVVQTFTINDDTDPTATAPADINVACLADVPVGDPAAITDEADNCTVNPTVTFESDASDGNTCNGEEITRTYRITDDCGNFTEVTQTITIDAVAPAFTVSGTDPTTCLGTDGTIVIAGLDASSNYEVSYGGGASNSITTNAAGEYTITGLAEGTYIDFTVTEATCSECSTTENVTITLTDPLPPAVDAGADMQVCENESITLTALNPDAANISWNNGVTDGVAFVQPVGSTTYTVTAELANCFATDDVIVVVAPTPNVSGGMFTEVCEGEQVTLSGSGAATYVWDNGVVDGVPFTQPLGTETYTVTGTSIFGCVATAQVQVRVLPVPVVSFTSNTREGCAPEEINFISTTGGVSNQCTFTIGGNVVLTGCNVSNIFTEAGCYDVNLEVELTNGCSANETIIDYICVDDYPIADFSIDPEELSTFNNEIDFTNESIGAVTYDWSFGDNTYSNSINPIHEYSVLGNPAEFIYDVKLIAYSDLGCADSIIGELPFYEDLIYNIPNTFTPDGNLYNETFKPVFTSGFDPLEYNLKIYNRWGELIFESNDPAYGWDGSYGSSQTIYAPDGTYLWKVSFKKLKDDENVEVIGSVNLLR
jgi:gliding motility-associated-like protein